MSWQPTFLTSKLRAMLASLRASEKYPRTDDMASSSLANDDARCALRILPCTKTVRHLSGAINSTGDVRVIPHGYEEKSASYIDPFDHDYC